MPKLGNLEIRWYGDEEPQSGYYVATYVDDLDKLDKQLEIMCEEIKRRIKENA